MNQRITMTRVRISTGKLSCTSLLTSGSVNAAINALYTSAWNDQRYLLFGYQVYDALLSMNADYTQQRQLTMFGETFLSIPFTNQCPRRVDS